MKKILTVAILLTLMFSAFAERCWEIPSWTLPGSSKCDEGWICGYDNDCVVRWTNLEYWSRHDGGIVVDIDEVLYPHAEAECWLVIYDGSTGVLDEIERKNITGCSQEYLDEVLYNLRDNKMVLVEKLETEKLEVEDFEFENVTTWDNADIQTYDKTEQKWYEKAIDAIVFWD